MAKYPFSIVIECTFDDEDGEYKPPTNHQIEERFASALHSTVANMGLDENFDIEAAPGTLLEAFGIGYEEEGNDVDE